MTGTLTDKVAIITGGARGIGAAIVQRFLAEGARVVSVDLELSAEAGGGTAPLQIACDVSQPDQVVAMIRQTVDVFGRIDIVVNNAGKTGGSGDFLNVSVENWRAYIDTNMTGVFLVSQAAARVMVEQKIAGRIITVGSINSFAAETGALPYVASKGGVLQLTKAMAVELAQYGILVNMIAPGSIRIDRNAALFDNEPFLSGFKRSIPLGHPGGGDDIAGVAVFLASDDARFVTGASLLVDGGLTALLRYD